MTIATHNIQGINNQIKFQQLIDFCHKNELNIISLTETKIVQTNFHSLNFENPHYKIFFANTTQKTAKERETNMGTAIAITKNLCCYIHNI